MLERSSAHDLVLAVALVAVGCSRAPAKPEADPAKVADLARQLMTNTPSVAAVPECTAAHNLGAAAAITQRSELALAGKPIPDKPEYAEWIHPGEIEHPAVRTLVDPKASTTARRQAAAELLAAPSYVVYQATMVNAPMALEVKELKRGVVGMRAIGYDKRGAATCASLFYVQNDQAKSEWAMDKSNRAMMDPEVSKALRDDLRAQLIKQVAGLPATLPVK